MLFAFADDLVYAFRQLRRSPRHAIIVAAILGLGIGANTAMFSALNHVLWRPFPFPDEGRLVRLREMTVDADGRPHPFNASSRAVLAIRDGAGDVFDGVVAMGAESMTVAGVDLPERVSVVLQTEGFERTLRVAPVLGRGLTAEEEGRGIDAGVALVSHAFWQTRFGGVPDAVGATVRLDDRPFTIVGVMPPQYAFPYDAQFWIPWRLDAGDRTHDFAVWAHLGRGITPRQMRASLDRVAASLRRGDAVLPTTYTFEATTLRENLTGTQDRPLRALAEIVGVMLLIAAVNVATLLLARSIPRRREFAVRAALGQTRARQASQLLAESLALATIGGAAGLLLSVWIAPLTAALAPQVLRSQLGLTTPQLDWRVAWFAVTASIVSAAIAGVVPALGGWRRDLQAALGGSSRGATLGRRARLLSNSLIAVEAALTLVLLAGAGLIIRNFVRLETERLGFAAHGLLAMELTPPAGRYHDGASRTVLVRRLVEEVSAAPGVSRAAVTTVNPLGGWTWAAPVISAEAAERDPQAALNANYRLISPGLFSTMGIAVAHGRDFAWSDGPDAPPVVIVSDRLARRLWPDGDAIGRRLRLARPDGVWMAVVGVVDNVSDAHDPGVPLETMYVPFAQRAEGSAAAEHFYVMVRDGDDPLATVADVRRAIARVDGALAPYAPAAMDAYYSESIARERTSAALMSAFGGFGLVLAGLGVYGVLALGVAQRTREFGIRMALGATLRDIVPAVFSTQFAMVAAGIVVGAAGAVGVGRAIVRLLPAAGGMDVPTVATAALLMLVAAALACIAPLRMVARVDPATALRD